MARPAPAWIDPQRTAAMRGRLQSGNSFPAGSPTVPPMASFPPFGPSPVAHVRGLRLSGGTEGSASQSPLLLHAGDVVGLASAATAEFYMETIESMQADIDSLQAQLRESLELRVSFSGEIEQQLKASREQLQKHEEHIQRLTALNLKQAEENASLQASNEKLRSENAKLLRKLTEMDATIQELKRRIAKSDSLLQLGEAVCEFRDLVIFDLEGKIDESKRSWAAILQLLSEERRRKTKEGQAILAAFREAYTAYVTEAEWQILWSLSRERNSMVHPECDVARCEAMLANLDEPERVALTKVLKVIKESRAASQADPC